MLSLLLTKRQQAPICQRVQVESTNETYPNSIYLSVYL